MIGHESNAVQRAELGSTLIELIVVIAIVAIVGSLGYGALAQRPAQARSSAVMFGGLIAQARALAAINGDASGTANTGASIAVVRDGAEYVATLYKYRPILGAVVQPVQAVNTPPLRTFTELAIVTPTGVVQPPFALFFSAAGHVSAAAPFAVGVDPPLAAEPACALQRGIIIAFIDGVANQGHALRCELAQLDLDTTYPVPH